MFHSEKRNFEFLWRHLKIIVFFMKNVLKSNKNYFHWQIIIFKKFFGERKFKRPQLSNCEIFTVSESNIIIQLKTAVSRWDLQSEMFPWTMFSELKLFQCYKPQIDNCPWITLSVIYRLFAEYKLLQILLPFPYTKNSLSPFSGKFIESEFLVYAKGNKI